MKTTLKRYESYDRTCIALTAKILKSKKHGIPATVQKTWKVYCDLAEPSLEMKMLFNKQAERWRAEWMKKWYPSGAPDQVLVQTEIKTETV